MSTRTVVPKAVAHQRARVASLSRSRGVNDPELIDARRQLRADRLEEFIKRTVEGAPALTEEQCARLAAILCPAQAGGGADAA